MLQVSHVSEAVRTLAEAGLITVVRLGRKNIYYVRDMGATFAMPPSDVEPFFRYLRQLGIRIVAAPDGLHYAPGSRKLDEFPLAHAIFNDYANGLIPRKFGAAIELLTPEAASQ